LFDQREADSTGEIVVSDARPWEQRIDEIFQQADQEFDKQKRKQLFAEFQKIVYDEAPYIYIASPDVLIGARRSVQNFSPTPLSQASIGLHNLEEIYIDTYKAAPVAAITGGATSK
jgi:ABC-type transport system substrate-binding protein